MNERRDNIIRIGTRESTLARLQTDIVAARLKAASPSLTIKIMPVTTRGDRVLDRPIAELGGRGVFVKELEEALFENEVDMVVHSLKDLPTELPDGLTLASVLDREDARDVIISRSGCGIAAIQQRGKVATSSRRRAAQLSFMRPDLEFVDIRGNIPTRLRKFDESKLDAIVLAAAGLIRLGLKDAITQYLAHDECTPAVGQGALAVECRLKDGRLRSLLGSIDENTVREEISAERAFLHRLGGGCSVPVGARAISSGGNIEITGCVAELDGSKIIRKMMGGRAQDAERIGLALAEEILSDGGDSILASLKMSAPNTISAP